MSTLPDNLSIAFTCGEFKVHQPLVHKCELPVLKEGLLLHRENLRLGEKYAIQLLFGRETVAESKGDMPQDHDNFFHQAFSMYAGVDKGLAKHIPIVGPFAEALMPDARWEYDLWYKLEIATNGELTYKVHFGPWTNIKCRAKLEGVVSLM